MISRCKFLYEKRRWVYIPRFVPPLLFHILIWHPYHTVLRLSFPISVLSAFTSKQISWRQYHKYQFSLDWSKIKDYHKCVSFYFNIPGTAVKKFDALWKKFNRKKRHLDEISPAGTGSSGEVIAAKQEILDYDNKNLHKFSYICYPDGDGGIESDLSDYDSEGEVSDKPENLLSKEIEDIREDRALAAEVAE